MYMTEKQTIRYNKFKSILKNFLIFFVIFNVLLFAKTIPHRVIGSPYPVGRMYMNAAATINFVYVKPALFRVLASLFHDTLYAPVFALRDVLYEQGLKYIPENDIEREVWFGKVKYFDYMFLPCKGDITYDQNELLFIYEKKIDKIERKYSSRLEKIIKQGNKDRTSLSRDDKNAYFEYSYGAPIVKREVNKLQIWKRTIDQHVLEYQKKGKIVRDPRMQEDYNLFLRLLLSHYPHIIKKYLYVTQHKATGSMYPSDIYLIKGETEKFESYFKLIKQLNIILNNQPDMKYKGENNPHILNSLLVANTDEWHYLDPILLAQYHQAKLDCKSEYYNEYLYAHKYISTILNNKKEYLKKENIDFTINLKKVSDMDKNYKLFTKKCEN